jgi:hypothetical protein
MTRKEQLARKGVLDIIITMIDFVKFIRMCCRAYRLATENGAWYVARLRHGVPNCAVFVGRGREAWRISHKAIEDKENV